MPCPPHICNFKIPIHTSDQKQTSFLCDTLSTLQHIFQSCVRYPFGTCPGGSEVKVSACNAEDLGSIPGSRRSPGKGNGNPLQYSCLENPLDGAWWATVHRVAKSRTWLSNFIFTFALAYIAHSISTWTRNHVKWGKHHRRMGAPQAASGCTFPAWSAKCALIFKNFLRASVAQALFEV